MDNLIRVDKGLWPKLHGYMALALTATTIFGLVDIVLFSMKHNSYLDIILPALFVSPFLFLVSRGAWVAKVILNKELSMAIFGFKRKIKISSIAKIYTFSCASFSEGGRIVIVFIKKSRFIFSFYFFATNDNNNLDGHLAARENY